MLKVMVLAMVLLFVTLIGFIFAYMNLFDRYHESDRITYVKLDPVGNWTVERTNRQMDDFYMATVDSSISRLLSKCLSNNPATIANDWAVCAAILSQDKLNEFYHNRFVKDKNFNTYVQEHSVCHNCDYLKFKVKDIDHKNSIPTSFTDVYNKPVMIYESIVYGDYVTKDNTKKSVVVDLKWSFVADSRKRVFGDLLIENPLGIYFVDYIQVEDVK
jgi:hypothetical protein